MTILTKWVTAMLVVALVAAGWSGWQAYQWRQAYYAEVIGALVYDVDMARAELARAGNATARGEKLEAMAAGHAYLVSAQENSLTLLERLAPFRKGKVEWMPKHYVPLLLQYARSLTPDLPPEALQRRVDLVGGLAEALKGGLTERPVGAWRKAVDVDRLKQSLDGYFAPMAQAVEPPRTLQFQDDWNRPTVTARQQGREVSVQVSWSQRFSLFPEILPGYLVLVRPGAGVTVSSDSGPQERLGLGAFPPYEVIDPAKLPNFVADAVPAGWTAGSYLVIRVPEGLVQTLTLRLPDGAKADLLLLSLVSRGTAVPIPME